MHERADLRLNERARVAVDGGAQQRQRAAGRRVRNLHGGRDARRRSKCRRRAGEGAAAERKGARAGQRADLVRVLALVLGLSLNAREDAAAPRANRGIDERGCKGRGVRGGGGGERGVGQRTLQRGHGARERRAGEHGRREHDSDGAVNERRELHRAWREGNVARLQHDGRAEVGGVREVGQDARNNSPACGEGSGRWPSSSAEGGPNYGRSKAERWRQAREEVERGVEARRPHEGRNARVLKEQRRDRCLQRRRRAADGGGG